MCPMTIDIRLISRYSFNLIPMKLFRQFLLNYFFISIVSDNNRFHDTVFSYGTGNCTSIHIVETRHIISFNKISNRFFTFPIARMNRNLIQDIPSSCRFAVLHKFIISAVIANQGIRQRKNLPFVRRIGKTFLISCHSRIKNKFANSLC